MTRECPQCFREVEDHELDYDADLGLVCSSCIDYRDVTRSDREEFDVMIYDELY